MWPSFAELVVINSLILSLLSNSDNQFYGQPGSLIESWSVSVPVSYAGIVSVTPSMPVELLAHTVYWLQIAPGNSSVNAGWNLNSTGAVGIIYQTTNGTLYTAGTSNVSAFEVLGTPLGVVPEPGFAVLPLPLLLLAIGYAKACRRIRCTRSSLPQVFLGSPITVHNRI